MKKLWYLLLLFSLVSLTFCCTVNDEKQNLDINVIGKVSNQNNVGIGGVNIYVQRGKWGNYADPSFNTYETITTNATGNYSYLVKNDTYVYKICCGIPAGYTIIEANCQSVNHSIINSQTVPNSINFILIK